MTKIAGFVNIVKPTGMTSSDVVLRVKKILKTKKVGHLGTLDPAASGVLPIAVGRATKFFDYFLNKDKEYFAVVKFGIETDTLDSFGNITNCNSKKVSKSDILTVLKDFIGDIQQIPPKYSAVKINGKKACDLAREDVEFEIKPRQVKIYDIELVNELEENMFSFKVHCSAGTYIRTLFSDIAKKLETISTTVSIIRTKSGRFLIHDAITLDELENSLKVQKIENLFSDLPCFEVDDFIFKKLVNGVKIQSKMIDFDNKANRECFLSYKNKTIGFYDISGEYVEPIVYLFEMESV